MKPTDWKICAAARAGLVSKPMEQSKAIFSRRTPDAARMALIAWRREVCGSNERRRGDRLG